MNEQTAEQIERMPEESIWVKPMTGSILVILSAISFLFLCMVLPLVGPAAVHGSGSPGAGPAPHLEKNITAFLSVLLLSLALAGAAFYSKIQRRKIDNSPYPVFSLGLILILLAVFFAHLAGLLAI